MNHQQWNVDAAAVLAQVLGPGENGRDRGVRGRLLGDLNRAAPHLLGNGESLIVAVEPPAELVDETGVVGGAGVRQFLESLTGHGAVGIVLGDAQGRADGPGQDRRADTP